VSFDEYDTSDARADAAQDRIDALNAEALDAYGTKEINEAISEHMDADLLRLIHCGDKRAGPLLAALLTADVDAFCKDWIENADDHRDHEAELTAAAGMVL